MSLKEQLNENIKNVDTKYLVMSLREIMSMYEDQELKINPIYQRGFRWDVQQKTFLIESLLLNFPLPPIFVYQTEEGIWELVDGVQRISTILEFFGKLETSLINKNHKFESLEQGKILTELKGINIEIFHKEYKEIILRLKKFPIHVVIIDAIQNGINNSKFEYEVFRRLNTHGTLLSKQEIRNVTLALRDKRLYEIIDDFTKTDVFTDIFKFGEKAQEERKDMEVIIQFYLLVNVDGYKEELRKAYDLYDVLDDISLTISLEEMQLTLEKMEEFLIFIKSIIGKVQYAFQPFSNKKEKFANGFQNHIFEILTLLYFKNKEIITQEFVKEIPRYGNWRTTRKLSNIKGHTRVLKVLEYVNELHG